MRNKTFGDRIADVLIEDGLLLQYSLQVGGGVAGQQLAGLEDRDRGQGDGSEGDRAPGGKRNGTDVQVLLLSRPGSPSPGQSP